MRNDGILVTEKPAADSNSTPKLTVETTNNHIYFYSEVNEDRCLALIKSIREMDNSLRNDYFSKSLDRLDYPNTPIWLHIQSPGGGLFSALAFIDQVKEIKTPIYSIVEGYAASAASLLSMCCTKRFIQPSSYLLIHQLSNFMWGKYEEFKDEMHIMDMAMDSLSSFYVAHSKLSKKKIKRLLGRDSWFNANECLENGFVDEIL
jgi:ATP-dependent protease ClpP protease subunit